MGLTWRSLSASLLSLLLGTVSLHADVKLPAVIGDNMVLQRDLPLPVWGTADAGEPVTVTFQGQQSHATADSKGRWKVTLHAIQAGGPHELTVTGKNTIRLTNVLVGDVWVCSGQSNMEWPVRLSADPETEIGRASFSKIRLFTVKKTVAAEPQADCTGTWSECHPETVAGFSAVGYFFGRELHRSLGVPIGLINTSWGGTPAESWTSLDTLTGNADLKPIVDRWNHALAEFPKANEQYQKEFADWKEAAEKAKAEGKTAPPAPRPPLGPDHPHRAAGLFNGMIVPLVPFAIRGAIWYQGESNAGRAYQYRTLLPAMIQDWREAWGQGEFPFLIVQLANFEARPPQPEGSDWAELREAQTMTLALPKTGMAVTIDIGEAKDIHPRNKQDVGRRLALAAQRIAYGNHLVYSGPVYDSMKIEGSKIRIRFQHVGGGLMAKGDAPLGFTIAGEERNFVPAHATIDGDTVVVWSDQVSDPVAVRYGWADNPVCNLYNNAELPASPFRTDDWPGLTKERR